MKPARKWKLQHSVMKSGAGPQGETLFGAEVRADVAIGPHPSIGGLGSMFGESASDIPRGAARARARANAGRLRPSPA